MDHIFHTGNNRKQVIYSMGEHIIMRNIRAEYVSRPAYLSGDHSGDLSAAMVKERIYYSYITSNGALALKNSQDGHSVFQLNADDNHRFIQSQTISFNDRIVLLYIVHDPPNSKWDVKYVVCDVLHSDRIPYSEHNISPYDLLCGLIYEPHFSVLDTGTHLIIDIHGGEDDSLWELSGDFMLISHDDISKTLKQQSVWQLEKIGSLQEDVSKLQQASNIMMNKISSLLDENKALRKELSSLNEEKNIYSPRLKAQDDKLKELSDSLTETKKALTIREAQIESAKKQYNEQPA